MRGGGNVLKNLPQFFLPEQIFGFQGLLHLLDTVLHVAFFKPFFSVMQNNLFLICIIILLL